MLILDRRLLSVLKGIKGVRSRRGKDVLSPPPSNTFAMPLATFLPFLTYLLGFGQRGKFLCGPFILRSLLFRIALRRAISSKKERKERRRERERAVLFFNLKPVFLLLMKRASKKILKFYYQISSSKEGGKIRLFPRSGFQRFSSQDLKGSSLRFRSVEISSSKRKNSTIEIHPIIRCANKFFFPFFSRIQDFIT